MLNRIRNRHSRRQDHDAPAPDRSDLRIRNLLDAPELQAVMGSSIAAPNTNDHQIDEPVAA